jgi:hypothetical protein
MTTTALPRRDVFCGPAVDADTRPHQPEPGTVDSGFNTEIEWQFAQCASCGGSISRFRPLVGGFWFDRWGTIHESEFLVDDRRPGG